MAVSTRTIAITVACLASAALLISLPLRETNHAASTDSAALQKNAMQRTSHLTDLREDPAVTGGQMTPMAHDEERLNRLQLELSAARAEQTLLMQRREAINAQITSHQEEGLQLLAALKEQRTRDDSPAFDSKAKSALEEMLAQDTAMTSELTSVEEQLTEKQTRIRMLATEIESTQASTKH